MNRILATFLLLTTAIASFAESKTLTVNFNESDFTFIVNSKGEMEIRTTAFTANFEDNPTTPALPFKPMEMQVPLNSVFTDHSVTVSKRLLKENVNMAPNIASVPTSTILANKTNTLKPTTDFASLTFPIRNVAFSFMQDYKNSTSFIFSVCPFEYDAATKRLYFIDRMQITVNYDTPNLESTNKTANLVLEESIWSPTFPNQLKTNEEYIIITSEALRPAFQKLATWKTIKGVKTTVVTTEQIAEQTKLTDKASSILTHINNLRLFKTDSLKYVLLGGAQDIIPVQKCSFTNADGISDSLWQNLPCDLYYANLFMDFNHNGIYGDEYNEMRHKIHTYIVTRLPVSTLNEAEAVVSKIINYEKSPLDAEWNDNILMCGSKIKYYNNENPPQSDSKVVGDKLYATYIEPYWSGSRVRFYDTFTDFPSGANHDLHEPNLQEELAKGYTFVNVDSHGNEGAWQLENGIYHITPASTLQSTGYSIITTSACYTNAIDSDRGLCLSEAFIRNPNNGVVAYLGSSREGWPNQKNDSESMLLGSSECLNGYFYELLLNNPDNHFGDVVWKAKSMSFKNFPMFMSVPHLVLAVNPIGDPEMPVYTKRPLPPYFPRMYSHQIDGKDYIYVYAPTNECTISVTSNSPDGTVTLVGVVRNQQKALFPRIMANSYNVCITAPGHAPCLMTVNPYATGFLSAGDSLDVMSVGGSNTQTSKLIQKTNISDYIITLPK